jgi:hypothetical protein
MKANPFLKNIYFQDRTTLLSSGVPKGIRTPVAGVKDQ